MHRQPGAKYSMYGMPHWSALPRVRYVANLQLIRLPGGGRI
jgi:hypothetical protein